MGLLIIITVFYLVLLYGLITILKEDKDLYFLSVLYVVTLFMSYAPLIDGMTNNNREFEQFKRKYEATEYLIKTYDKNNDINGDILFKIKKDVETINTTINYEKKGLKKPLTKQIYVQKIADTEPIKFDYNNLIKDKENE